MDHKYIGLFAVSNLVQRRRIEAAPLLLSASDLQPFLSTNIRVRVHLCGKCIAQSVNIDRQVSFLTWWGTTADGRVVFSAG